MIQTFRKAIRTKAKMLLTLRYAILYYNNYYYKFQIFGFAGIEDDLFVPVV